MVQFSERDAIVKDASSLSKVFGGRAEKNLAELLQG
jgi:hypothetical protein